MCKDWGSQEFAIADIIQGAADVVGFEGFFIEESLVRTGCEELPGFVEGDIFFCGWEVVIDVG